MQDTWITDWEPSERWPHYTRSNAGEVLPTPASPLGQQFCWDRAIIPGWRDGYVRQGSYSLDEFDPVMPECNGFFGGYSTSTSPTSVCRVSAAGGDGGTARPGVLR